MSIMMPVKAWAVRSTCLRPWAIPCTKSAKSLLLNAASGIKHRQLVYSDFRIFVFSCFSYVFRFFFFFAFSRFRAALALLTKQPSHKIRVHSIYKLIFHLANSSRSKKSWDYQAGIHCNST